MDRANRGRLSLAWVVLTTGSRPESLRRALRSIEPDPIVLVRNGRSARDDGEPGFGSACRTVEMRDNVGIPAGRDHGVAVVGEELVGFLDDDAVLSPGGSDAVRAAFEGDPRLGAVSLRLVDEDGDTARRHVPRPGGRHPERSGEVALFLGGACAIRRTAYHDAGGYWGDLFYGHEELELCWRLVDRGWRIQYLADATVFHPRTEIGRHPVGWQLTGRNRVRIARRTLPWPIALCHVTTWLLLGLRRAPGRENRRAYLSGWWAGWSDPIERRPIAWRTVWRLTRLGRPPIL